MTHPFREALSRPISHAIHPTDSQRSGAVEANPSVEQLADGGPVWRAGRKAMAKVHGRRDSARNQSAHFVLRDGSARVGCENARSNLESDARGRRDNRSGERVIPRGTLAAALPNALTQHSSIFEIVRASLRDSAARVEQTRAALLSYPLFVRAGSRAAELWLGQSAVSMADFRDHRFANLLDGLAPVPSDEDRRTAFNDAFARRIATAIAQAEVFDV